MKELSGVDTWERWQARVLRWMTGVSVLFQGLIGPDFSGWDKDGAWTNCGAMTIQ